MNLNLQDTPSAGPLMDSDFGYLDATPVPPPAVRCTPKKRGLLSRAWRAVQRGKAWQGEAWQGMALGTAPSVAVSC